MKAFLFQSCDILFIKYTGKHDTRYLRNLLQSNKKYYLSYSHNKRNWRMIDKFSGQVLMKIYSINVPVCEKRNCTGAGTHYAYAMGYSANVCEYHYSLENPAIRDFQEV